MHAASFHPRPFRSTEHVNVYCEMHGCNGMYNRYFSTANVAQLAARAVINQARVPVLVYRQLKRRVSPREFQDVLDQSRVLGHIPSLHALARTGLNSVTVSWADLRKAAAACSPQTPAC